MFFGKRKRTPGADDGIQVRAPLAGSILAINQVNDPTFSEELLGPGIAIRPTAGRVVSPVKGVVTQMFETGHAVSITSVEGIELLIHVGLDTVRLKGKHYTIRAHSGDTVKPGDLLIEFDPEAIAAEGFDTVTPVVICNMADFSSIAPTQQEAVAELDGLLTIQK